MNIWHLIGNSILPDLTWKKSTTKKEVFLTFDDGPHPEITPWVMKQLELRGAKGTFFMVGENAKRYPLVVRNVLSKGHQIGNHTYHHIKGWKTSPYAYQSDIERCYEFIPRTGLFRPPYGQINFKAINAILKENEIIMWDVLSKDYLPKLNKDYALKRIKRLTVNGSIVVFHDSEKAEKNLKYLLPKYLDFLVENDFEINTL